jgi:hypothetical protein
MARYGLELLFLGAGSGNTGSNREGLSARGIAIVSIADLCERRRSGPARSRHRHPIGDANVIF